MADETKSPRKADEQDYPEPERLVTPAEEAGMDLAEMEEPPQAEGPRDLEEDAAANRQHGEEERKGE